MGQAHGNQIESDPHQVCKFSTKAKNFAVTYQDIKRLYKRFNKLDKDNSGQLEPEEFFDIPGNFFCIKKTQLYHKTLWSKE